MHHTAAAPTLRPPTWRTACCHLKTTPPQVSVCFLSCLNSFQILSIALFFGSFITLKLPLFLHNVCGKKVTRGQKISSIIIITTEPDPERLAQVSLSQQVMISRAGVWDCGGIWGACSLRFKLEFYTSEVRSKLISAFSLLDPNLYGLLWSYSFIISSNWMQGCIPAECCNTSVNAETVHCKLSYCIAAVLHHV